jgi:hypothetical protein
MDLPSVLEKFAVRRPAVRGYLSIFLGGPWLTAMPIVLSCRGVVALLLRLAHSSPLFGIGFAPPQMSSTGFLRVLSHIPLIGEPELSAVRERAFYTRAILRVSDTDLCKAKQLTSELPTIQE